MRRTLITASFLIPCLGCGTPNAVKKLSAAQSATMASYQTTLQQYFAVITAFAEEQVAATNEQIDALTAQQDRLDQSKAKLVINAADADATKRNESLTNFADTITKRHADDDAKKAQIRALVDKVEAKQSEMMKAYQQMLEAQKKLDEYVQLKKTDDTILDEIAGVLGLTREKLDQNASDISNIITQVTNLNKK
jgi:hypothetical protein